LIKKLHKLSIAVDVAELTARPARALAKLVGADRIEVALSGIGDLDNWSSRAGSVVTGIWRLRYGVESYHHSHAVRALAKAGAYIGTLGNGHVNIHYHDVMGIPVACEPYEGSDVFHSPASAGKILERVRGSGTRWVVTKDGALHRDEAPLFPIMAKQTRELIDRIRPFDTCRAVVVWGPPRGGKSVAARQIAHEIAGGWVRVCGAASTSPEVWRAVHDLAPRALILDDLDACAHAEDDLLAWLEEARGYARVIVSTMNILPTKPARGEEFLVTAEAARERRKHELRGAVLAPGRAADEEPRHYAELDAEIRAALAPDVPEDLRTEDLLAAYLVELQQRAVALGKVTIEDLEEMRRRMAAVGER
jgi:hypothetical protein